MNESYFEWHLFRSLKWCLNGVFIVLIFFRARIYSVDCLICGFFCWFVSVYLM